MNQIDLALDDENELVFKVTVEGTSPAETSYRFLIEGSDMSFSFPGVSHASGEVEISIPPMGRLLREGEYEGNLEVIVDDRIFTPLRLIANFEKSVKVTAESVTKKKMSASASATLISGGTRTQRPRIVERDVRQSPKPAPPAVSPASSVVSPVKPKASRLSESPEDVSNLSEPEIRDLVRKLLDSKK